MREGMIMVVVLMACASAGVWAQREGTSRFPSAEVIELGKRNNEFAWNMYGQLKGEQGNLFFSPYSLRTALAMTFAGAKGETATQMRHALRLTLKDEAMHAAFAQTVKGLKPGEDGGYMLTLANRLWGQKGYKWLDSFLNIAQTYYGGGLNEVDFAGATEEAWRTINAWVETTTHQRITDVIPKGGVDRLTRLVLVNAIWFKGEWLYPFEKAATQDGPFSVNSTETVTAPLMHRQGGGYRYAEGDGVQILELPYRGDTLSMVVLLPQAKDGLARLESSLTNETPEAWMGRVGVPAARDVDVYLPKFKMTWGTKEMKESFTALGMAIPFEIGKADFSGINGIAPPADEALSIAKIFHKAFVEVNEEGTEATAATAVQMAPLAAPFSSPPVFRADHPCIFLIRDTVSGSILFLGRLLNPRTP
jgi:serpin B